MSPVVYRAPRVADGPTLWRLARSSGVLDPNSPYYYLAFCTRFADSSIVAEEGDRVQGFVTGLLHPDPGTLFVWQVGVDADARGRGLASGMLDALLGSGPCRRVARLDTTVTPSNQASLALFRALGRRWGARVDERPYLAAEDFPAEGDHEPERLLSIAPLRRDGPAAAADAPG